MIFLKKNNLIFTNTYLLFFIFLSLNLLRSPNMNPSENFPPSFITTYVGTQGNNTLTVSSPLPQTVHDTSTQTLYQPPQQTYQPSVASAQTSYENPILPVHPTAFFYRPSNDFCHY